MKKIYSPNTELMQVQDAVAESLAPLEKHVLLTGVLLNNVEIVAGITEVIGHGLGRSPRGYLIVKKNADANVWESDGRFSDKLLHLNASANVTVSIWVF
jgi:hypothetical protein